jgi:hypothetical protein
LFTLAAVFLAPAARCRGVTSDVRLDVVAADPNLSALLEQEDLSSNRDPAPGCCLSMIFCENRFPLFRIMR